MGSGVSSYVRSPTNSFEGFHPRMKDNGLIDILVEAPTGIKSQRDVFDA